MLKYISLKENHTKLILKWRLMPHVTKFMCSDIDKDFEKHNKWYKGLINNKKCKYWLISYDGKNIGLVYLTEIDYYNGRCKLGFYIGEQEYIGLGGLFLPPVYNYIFSIMGLQKIYGKVLDGNALIITIHKLHGWRRVGTYKNHICKNSIFHDVHLFELLKNDWSIKPNYKHNNFSSLFE